MSEQTKKALAPELRFPEFSGEPAFEEMALSDLLFETKKRNRDLKFGKSEVLSVSGEYGCVNQIAFMGRSYAGVSVKDYHVVGTGDIVYTKSPLKASPYGIIKENKGEPGIVSTLYAVYGAKKTCLPNYLDHYFTRDYNLNSYLQPLVNKGAKNDMKVKNADVLKGKIFIPKFREQQKIADCLTSLDELIATHIKKYKALQSYKKGLVQKLFPGEGETIPALRFPEYQGSGEWNISTIDEIASISSGGTPSRSKGSYWGGNIPWVSTTLIDFNTIEGANEFITETGLKNSSSKIFPKGTVLMAMYGQGKTRGRVAMLGVKAAINQACAAISLKASVDSKFVFQNLAARYDEIRKISNSGGQENLSATLIKTISFAYPDIDSGEQKKIADCLSSVDDLVAAQAQTIDDLKVHKDGLMQVLFPSNEAVES